MLLRLSVLLASCVAALALAGSALAGFDYIGASPGVYARIGPTPYTNSFNWRRIVGGQWEYNWYVFTAGGTLQGSGIHVTSATGLWGGGYNYRYWKFYNPGYNPGVQGFNVCWPPDVC